MKDSNTISFIIKEIGMRYQYHIGEELKASQNKHYTSAFSHAEKAAILKDLLISIGNTF